MDQNKQDSEKILKQLIDEINNFDLFIQIWENTAIFLRDETDYVKKASKLIGVIFKFTAEPCCVIFYLTNMLFKNFIIDYLVKFVLSSVYNSVKKNFLVALEQLITVDYNEKAISFRNERLNAFYGEKFVNLIKEINDLAIELSFKNEFNAKFSLWGKKNLEHGLSLIRYVLKTVGSKTLIGLGYKHQHFDFIVNTFSKFNILPKIMEAMSSNCNKFDIENNDVMDKAFLTTLDTIYLIILKTFSSTKFYNLNPEVHNINLITIKNLVQFYDENVRSGNIVSNYSLWNHTLSKIVEFTVQKTYEESEKKYIRLRFNYICYFLQKLKILFEYVTEFKKQKYTEKLMFSIKRILISIDQSRKFRELENDEIEAKAVCFHVIYEIIKNLKENFVSSQMKNFSHIWIRELSLFNLAAIDCLKLIFKLKNASLKLFSKNIIELIKRQISTKEEFGNLAKYSIAVQSVFEFESTNDSNNLISKELIQIVMDIQKVLSNQILGGNYNNLNEFLAFSKKILFTIKKKNGFIENSWDNFLIEIFLVCECIKSSRFNFEMFPNIYQNCFELIKIMIDMLNGNKTVNLYTCGIFETLSLIKCNLPVNCPTELRNELYQTMERVKPLTAALFN